MKTTLAIFAAVCCCIAVGVHAAPFLPFDPRALGMGGAGVASGTSANAALFNPALLAAARRGEDFSLELPMAGVGVADPQALRAALADFANRRYVVTFSNVIQSFNNEVNRQLGPPANLNVLRLEAARDTVVSAGHALVDALENLADKSVKGSGNVAMVIGIPGKSYGASVFINAWMAGGMVGQVSDADRAASAEVLDAMAKLDLLSPATAVAALRTVNLIDPSTAFTSNVRGRFAVFGETGVALAREVPVFGHRVSIGVTPKFVRVWTFDYKFIAREMRAGGVDLAEGRNIHDSFNLDVGAAKDYGNGWKSGLVVKDLLPHTYRTVLGNDIVVDPQVRLGVARQVRWFSVTADVDLTDNRPVDFEGWTRYLSLGAELDAWRTLQLRFGYRHDLNRRDSGMLALGAGLSPFGIHIDAGIAGNRNEAIASAQTGFRF